MCSLTIECVLLLQVESGAPKTVRAPCCSTCMQGFRACGRERETQRERETDTHTRRERERERAVCLPCAREKREREGEGERERGREREREIEIYKQGSWRKQLAGEKRMTRARHCNVAICVVAHECYAILILPVSLLSVMRI